jgi:hypothetical protein
MRSRTSVGVRPEALVKFLIVALLTIPGAFDAGFPARAADDAKAGGIGRLESATGTLLRREGADKEWKVVANGATVPGEELLLALPGVHAAIKSANGAVLLTLWGNLPQESPTPALESAVTLQRSSDSDLDLYLDRGRILVANTKEKGSANIRVRARKEIWDLVLGEPGSTAAIEFNARWMPGVPYREAYKEGEEPKAEMILLVLKGTAELKVEDEQRSLRAPPGPALFSWDSNAGLARSPLALEKLPPWAEPGAANDPPTAAVNEALKPLISSLANKPANAAIAEFRASAEKASGKEKAELIRQLAVTGFGAIDDLPDLFKALGSEKDALERVTAIETLRHWIGRKPRQDAALGKFLVGDQNYSQVHAATVLQLLHSYGQKDIEDPLTYEVLIADLQHEKLPIRELAAWHLYRLAPAGREIRYDAAAREGKREEAVKAWKQLIPAKKLPPAPRPK